MPLLLLALAAVQATPAFCPPQPWALGFATPPRIPLVGDVNHDGLADLICVYPPGDSIIDVDLTVEGVKSAGGAQALTGWGKDCQAAVAGNFDDTAGADVVGIFGGKTLRLAGSYKDGQFQDNANWVRLPTVVKKPVLGLLNGKILAYSPASGDGYLVEGKQKVVPIRLPKGFVWIGEVGGSGLGQNQNGDVFRIEETGPDRLKLGPKIGREDKSSRPAVGDGVLVYGDQAIRKQQGTVTLDPAKLPDAPVVRQLGDIDGDGDQDIVEFRYGTEAHTGNDVLIRRTISPNETDPDRDGLSNDEEKPIGTDPYNPDTDNDGLLDGWEVKGYRGLDFKTMGCSPLHADLVCLISRFQGVDEARTKAEMARADRFYKELKTSNPDGNQGLSFHPVYIDEVKGDDTKNPWWGNRGKFRPEKWRGVVHWMQVTPGGGGQADELGDGGTIGEGAMWAVFVHEFGHQMGMNHEGFWPNGMCPIYTSLMNYCYSYSFEDDREKIHYSDGSLIGYVLNETDLDETIPLPYEKVKFLEKGPYRFRLKPNGKTTLIDWNWNGIFGEKHVKADINYSYSTNAGTRDDVGKSMTSPWLFTHQGRAFVLFGQHDLPADPKTDPSLASDKPGKLLLRRLVKPFVWDKPWTLEAGGLIGDPVAISFGGKVLAFYQTKQGVVSRSVDVAKDGLRMSEPVTIVDDASLVPTVGLYQGRLYLFLWNPADGKVSYKVYDRPGHLLATENLDQTSTNPVGLCTDKRTGEAVIGMAQNQDDKRPNRWQIRRYVSDGTRLRPKSLDWIEGKDGQSRGTGRITVLSDPKDGRIACYGRGMTSKDNPWSCTYVAQEIADKTVHGGWLVKRYYDEWTQSRSAPAAAWFGGDVIWAYRWVDGGQGATDNNLHVGYRGSGVQTEPMGDHDDISFIRNFGIRHSLLSLGNP